MSLRFPTFAVALSASEVGGSNSDAAPADQNSAPDPNHLDGDFSAQAVTVGPRYKLGL
jgi:hypothetical protein